jgi:hypothetical protein
MTESTDIFWFMSLCIFILWINVSYLMLVIWYEDKIIHIKSDTLDDFHLNDDNHNLI